MVGETVEMDFTPSHEQHQIQVVLNMDTRLPPVLVTSRSIYGRVRQMAVCKPARNNPGRPAGAGAACHPTSSP